MTKAWGVVVALLLTAALATVAAAGLPSQSFLYQIRNVDLVAVAGSGYGVVILDPSRDGNSAADWSPAEIADLHAAGKTVLAVIRVAEAEESRFYWDPAWADPDLAPSWLGPAVDEAPGTYRVRYWDPGWAVVVQANLDRVVAQGFDGVVLDSTDAYLYWLKAPAVDRNPQAPGDMIALVSQLAAYVRALPGKEEFFVVPENGADLIASDAYLGTISGIIAEHVWFTGNKRQKSRISRNLVLLLDRVAKAGKPVFVSDDPSTDRRIDTFYDLAESKLYVPLVTTAERDTLTLQPRHPPGVDVPFTPMSPPHNADFFPKVAPTFTWSPNGEGTFTYRINFSGSDQRQQVLTFPKSGVLKDPAYTPSAAEWRAVQRRAHENPSARIYWWVTSRTDAGDLRSSPAQALNRMHAGISTTIFWVGAEVGATMPNDRASSAWDSQWVAHFGGIDDPQNRSSENIYWPADFTPLENPFYVALPYNDLNDAGMRRPKIEEIIPWARFTTYGPLESAVKNRWVKVQYGGNTCYAQWEDVGPLQNNDFRYVFGTNKPRNKQNLNAGLEVSPALRDCLGLGSIGATNWRVVFDDETVPDGAWTEIVTTSQVTP